MDDTNNTSQNYDEASEQNKSSVQQDIPESQSQTSQNISKEARMWAMFCHLAGLIGLTPVLPGIGCVIGPLVVWQLKKEEHAFIDENGKEAFNFNISFWIYGAVAALSFFICIGIILAPAVGIVYIICLIIASIKANEGQCWKYPYIIRFIK